MKKIIIVVASVFAMNAMIFVQSMPLSAGLVYHLESDGLYYRYSRGGLELMRSDYTKEGFDIHAEYAGDIVVPDSVYSPDFEQNLAVLTVGEEAFAYCDDLKSVKLPSTVDKIKDNAFYSSKALVAVDMSACDKITAIPRMMFAGTSSLSEVKLPHTLRKIGGGAFRDSGITDFIVPDGVDSIGDGAFLDSSLKHFKMGKSLKVLGSYALNLDLETAEWNDSLTDIGIYAFHGMDTVEVVLPKSVRLIESGAFAEMSSLKRLVCRVENPDDIEVHELAFAIAANSDDWYYMGIPMAPMRDIEHTSVPEGCVLYVPAQSVELYRQADVWKEFAEIRAIDDEETALEQLTPAAGADGATYDLMGRRVESPRPGQLVVSGGKLRLIR